MYSTQEKASLKKVASELNLGKLGIWGSMEESHFGEKKLPTEIERLVNQNLKGHDTNI